MAGTYQPTIADIIDVKGALANPVLGISLPLELVEVIIDHAEYWPHTSVTLPRPSVARAPATENLFCLRSPPLGLRTLDPSLEDDGDEDTSQSPESSQTPGWSLGFLSSHMADIWTAVQQRLGWGTTSTRQETSRSRRVTDAWLPPRGQHPCRKIVFNICSHDQGWSSNPGRGSYVGSYTWFDARRESTTLDHKLAESPSPSPLPPLSWLSELSFQHRPEEAASAGVRLSDSLFPGQEMHPFLPQPDFLQLNLHAVRNTEHHTVVWRSTDAVDAESVEADELEQDGRGRNSMTGEFVRSLVVGDCVALWARARFPGWANHVERATVDVYWAV